MRKYLFSSKAIRGIAVVAAVAAVAAPASSASASTGSSTLLVTAKGTSILGQVIPVLVTKEFYVMVPVDSTVPPGETLVWNALDFTVSGDVKLLGIEIVDLYLDPK